MKLFTLIQKFAIVITEKTLSDSSLFHLRLCLQMFETTQVMMHHRCSRIIKSDLVRTNTSYIVTYTFCVGFVSVSNLNLGLVENYKLTTWKKVICSSVEYFNLRKHKVIS